MNAVVLTVEGVTVRFGGITAVDRMSLTARRGRVHGLIGRNGAGKTTLFDVVSGHRLAQTGRVEILGTDVTARSAHARARMGLARTFQSGSLVADLTALENVILGSDHARRSRIARPPSADRATAIAFLADLGIADVADTECAEMPPGTQRLVEVARATASGAAIVLLDEPGAGLSADETRRFVAVVRSLAQAGRSILVTDHSLDLISAACDEVAVMSFGRCIAAGSLKNVLADPRVVDEYLGIPPDG